MYARTLADDDGAVDVLDFGVSGNLWHGVLVMYDRASGSFWTQLDGRSIEGRWAGRRLEHRPSTFTSWAQWKAEHPDTEVLLKGEDERGQAESAYADYFADPERLFLPQLGEGLGGARPKDVVFGLALGGEALAVTEDLLFEARVLNLVVGGRPVALLAEPRSGEVRAVERREGQREILLEALEGTSTLERVARASGGASLDPAKLTPLRVDRAYWYAWARSHPRSRIMAD